MVINLQMGLWNEDPGLVDGIFGTVYTHIA